MIEFVVVLGVVWVLTTGSFMARFYAMDGLVWCARYLWARRGR